MLLPKKIKKEAGHLLKNIKLGFLSKVEKEVQDSFSEISHPGFVIDFDSFVTKVNDIPLANLSETYRNALKKESGK